MKTKNHVEFIAGSGKRVHVLGISLFCNVTSSSVLSTSAHTEFMPKVLAGGTGSALTSTGYVEHIKSLYSTWLNNFG